MPSYLRRLLAPLVGETAPTTDSSAAGSAPTALSFTVNVAEPSPPASEAGIDYGRAADLEDDDAPPPFPLPNSIQRSSGARIASSEGGQQANSGPNFSLTSANAPTPASNASPDFKRMPPPALPLRLPLVSTPTANTAQQRSTISIPSVGGLALPPSTTVPMPNVNKKGKARAKVALTPGHGALDWAQLKSSGADLRGVTELMRVTPSMLKEHRSKDDAWSAFSGKVYNITPYLPYHPGGERELMRVAGRDGSKLFATTHAWVNLDFMLDGCLVGFLVPE